MRPVRHEARRSSAGPARRRPSSRRAASSPGMGNGRSSAPVARIAARARTSAGGAGRAHGHAELDGRVRHRARRPHRGAGHVRGAQARSASTSASAARVVGIAQRFAGVAARGDAAIDLAAGRRLLVEERRGEAEARATRRGRESCGPRADDGDVDRHRRRSCRRTRAALHRRRACPAPPASCRPAGSARRRSRPAQSKHVPIMQTAPRGAPGHGVVRKTVTPAASSAAATVSPARATNGAPSIVRRHRRRRRRQAAARTSKRSGAKAAHAAGSAPASDRRARGRARARRRA